MLNINKKIYFLGFIFFVFVVYAELARSSTSVQQAIRTQGIDSYIEEFVKKPIVFLPNLQTKHTQVNKRDIYYHTVFTDFEHQTKIATTQTKSLIAKLIPHVCSDIEIAEILRSRATLVITFESPKGIALGGVKINNQKCIDTSQSASEDS